MNSHYDDINACLLELIQRDFPITRRPFDLIGSELGISVQEAMSRIKCLKEARVIRQIGAIFDSAALGYHSSLVAFRVGEEYLDAVAAGISAHNGVSHCYSRDASYNLWFTITVGPGIELESEVTALADLQGVLSYMILPSLKVFKIGVFLKMNDEVSEPVNPHKCKPSVSFDPSDIDYAAVKTLQKDLPIVEGPFAQLAVDNGMSEDDLIERARYYCDNGIMRRFAAVLYHRHAGYKSNAMVCWLVKPDRVDTVGAMFAAEPVISHCYTRPTYPDWPYSLYTMIHCKSDEELSDTIQRLEELSGVFDYLVLRTGMEYKKSRVLYFQ